MVGEEVGGVAGGLVVGCDEDPRVGDNLSRSSALKDRKAVTPKSYQLNFQVDSPDCCSTQR